MLGPDVTKFKLTKVLGEQEDGKISWEVNIVSWVQWKNCICCVCKWRWEENYFKNSLRGNKWTKLRVKYFLLNQVITIRIITTQLNNKYGILLTIIKSNFFTRNRSNFFSKFIYLCACMCARSCLTLCDPIDCSPPVSCLWDFPGKTTAILFSRGSSRPSDWTGTSYISCIFTIGATWESLTLVLNFARIGHRSASILFLFFIFIQDNT